MPLDRFEELLYLAPPPPTPIATGDPNAWKGVFKHLGTPLPRDYVRFISVYGSGGFYNYLGISSPFSRRLSLIKEWETYRPLFEQHLLLAPTLFPEPDGLLLCGGTEANDLIFWHTRSAPDEWKIVVLSDDFLDAEIFQTGLVGFLADWLSGRAGPQSSVRWRIRERPKPVFKPHSAELD